MYGVIGIMYDIMYYVSCTIVQFVHHQLSWHTEAGGTLLSMLHWHTLWGRVHRFAHLLIPGSDSQTHVYSQTHKQTHKGTQTHKHIQRHSETKSKDCFVTFLSWVGVLLSFYLLLTCVSSESEWSKRSRKVTGWEETCARWSISCQVHISQEVPLSYRKTRQTDNKPTLISCHFLVK